MEKFRQLGVSEHVLKSIEERKFTEPTEIQDKAIPLILEGKDVIAGAATGSGKTLVFASGIVHNMEHGKGIQSLILTPTRELAEQVSEEMIKFSKYRHLSVVKVYGGVSINPQIDGLRNADIVVGTPGRILDHINRRTIRFENVKILVLDEADRMLDMGFRDDVEKIIRQCPKQRQTMLFSATISADIVDLARKYMINPVEISAKSYVDDSKLEQVYYDVRDNLKFSLLVHLLKKETSGLVMVFCNTQRNTDFVAKNLRRNGINVLAIHGGHSQNRRSRTMEDFNANKADVLVCTDVAARGLDIKEVSHIYNYDAPKDSKEYIHRIGRTARAGKDGKAISLLISRDYENFNKVIEDDALIIKKRETPYVEQIPLIFDSRPRFGQNRFGNNQRSFNNSRGRFNSEGKRSFNNGRFREKREYPGRFNDGERKRSFNNNRFGEKREYPRRFNNRGEGQRSFSQNRFGNNREYPRRFNDNRFGNSRGYSGRFGNKGFGNNREDRQNKSGNNGEGRRSFGQRRFGSSRFRGSRKRNGFSGNFRRN